ncbi:MAG: 1,6-anhydro-N-acetylmuramyl-L-alanine amidase AmpD [Candidatus Electrothrix sp. AR4]|nr:1,6-anhydro-N-acetylmuramyl-L-alanine amidase AmpD [Candidatus Electrothrix sp. AR4]
MTFDKTIRHLPTDQYEERPEGMLIDTLIIHSMHNPASKDRFSAISCKECLDTHGVSVHYLIDCDGTVWRTVPEEKKAWHAGVSRMPEDAREGVNDFSIGIELIGTEDTDFTSAQYQTVALLTKDILSRHAVQHIYGHCDIAPGRKTDPWGFDWPRYRKDVLRCCAAAEVWFCQAAMEDTKEIGMYQLSSETLRCNNARNKD